MAEPGAHGIGTRTLRGMLWAYGSYVAGRVLILASTAILARILTPREFGVVAFALILMTLLDSVKDLGLSQALIVATPEEEEARAQTVFGWSIALGLLLTVVTAALAPVAAAFAREPELTRIVPVLALNFLFRSLGLTHYALARKHLDYRARTFAETADVVTRGVGGIVLALLGFGAWSLVLGYLIGTLALAATAWTLVPFRPRLRLGREHLRDLLAFGGTLSVIDILHAIYANLDFLFVGRVLGPASLGLYTIGFRLPELLIINLSVVAGNVLFPAYSAIERDRLHEAFLLSLRYTAMLVFPLGAGLALLARPVILALFGEQWRPSIAVMQILAIYAVVATLDIPAGTIYKATRRARLLLAFGIPHILGLIGALLLFADRGIVAVALCVAVLAGIVAVFQLSFASRLLGVPLRRMAGVLVVPVVATAAVVVVLVPIRELVDAPWPALVLGAVAGTATYLGMLWLLAREDLMGLRDMAFPGVGLS